MRNIRLTKRISHDTLCGTRWFAKAGACAEYVVAFLDEGSVYCLVNIEDGTVPFSNDNMQDLIKELKNNYE